jgi:NAD-dependent SIR2 family protein deacetylase
MGARLIICNLQTTPYDQHADLVMHEKIENVAEELLLSRVLD